MAPHRDRNRRGGGATASGLTDGIEHIPHESDRITDGAGHGEALGVGETERAGITPTSGDPTGHHGVA